MPSMTLLKTHTHMEQNPGHQDFTTPISKLVVLLVQEEQTTPQKRSKAQSSGHSHHIALAGPPGRPKLAPVSLLHAVTAARELFLQECEAMVFSSCNTYVNPPRIPPQA